MEIDAQEARIEYATMLERVVGRLNHAASSLRQEMKQNPDIINGEVDLSYAETIKVLDAAKRSVNERCDEVWRDITKNAIYSRENAENLCNAVIIQAVLDYESALSTGDKPAMHEIERFARSGDSQVFSSVELPSVLEKARKVYPEFLKLIQARGDEIVKDTARKRKKRETYASGPVKCPLCGGALYHYGSAVGDAYKIVCVGCNLEGWYHAGQPD